MLKKSALSLAVLVSGTAYASGSVQDSAMQCTLMEDKSLRLACFDTIYAAQYPPTQPIKLSEEATKAIDLVKTFDRIKEQGSSGVLVFDSADAIINGVEATPTLKEAAEAYTPLSTQYDLDKNDDRGIFSIRVHEPMYLLPAWYNASPNNSMETPSRDLVKLNAGDQKHLETKMQVSFKSKLMEEVFKTRADLWFGYTQVSHWQLYNQKNSAPFRNTDYMPELFLTQPVKANLPGGGRLRMLGVGVVHQSNGRTEPLSRSWNRIYGMAGMEWGKLTVIPRVWVRAFEDKNKDDNPDVSDYMGHGDLKLQYRFSDKRTLGSSIRYNPKSGKGGVQVDYTFPVVGKMKGYVQGFHGYGQNMLDYNHKHNSVGIGVMFNDWDGF